MAKSKKLINLMIFGMTILFSMPTFATEIDGSIANCLKAWGKHPFGNSPNYKTLATSVKVFGIGEDPNDSEVTNSPSLVLVNPGVNVMGGSTIELLNPNGWYCLQTNVNVMGGLMALGVLFAAVAQGLLSSPDMQITGNQSSAFLLNWYQDRSLPILPTATVISVPLIVYRLLMLAWALWLAVSLLNWLKWGWACFSSNGLWNKAAAKEKEVVVDAEKQ